MIFGVWLLKLGFLPITIFYTLSTHLCFIHSGGLKNVHDKQSMCMFYGFTADEDNAQCTNPESFTSFLGLLGSIPLHGTGPDEHTIPDSR